MKKTYDIQIPNVDLDLLREQKKQLLYLMERKNQAGDPVCRAMELVALDGIIGLVDAIQDGAVEQHGLDEAEVFKFNND